MLNKVGPTGPIRYERVKPTDTEFQQSVILTPKNIDVLELNNKILCRIDDTLKDYLRIDVAEDADNNQLDKILPIEFLNSLTPNSVLPHRLQLIKRAIIMLLRNINLNNGLCNGTRLLLKDMKEFCIQAEIIRAIKLVVLCWYYE